MLTLIFLHSVCPSFQLFSEHLIQSLPPEDHHLHLTFSSVPPQAPQNGDPSPQNHVLVSQGFNSKFEKPDWSSLSQVFPSSPVSCGRGTGVTLHLNLLERDRSLRRRSRETETIWQQIAKNKQTKKKTPPKVCFPPEKKKMTATGHLKIQRTELYRNYWERRIWGKHEFHSVSYRQ